MSEDFRYYPKAPVVGVGAAVIHEGKILLIRRGKEPFEGLWAIPGGVQRVGESIEDAVRRELREEVGIDGVVEGILWVDELIQYEGGRIKYHYVIIDTLVKPLSTDVRPGSDVLEARWFDLSTDWESLETSEPMRRFLRSLSKGEVKPLPYNPTIVLRR